MNPTIELVNILGAAALLLWGLGQIKLGIMRAFGASLRQWIAKGTKNRVLAAFWGFIATLALQSSTAVAVITASFAAREFISLGMAQAVMLGANLGTSIVALVLSADVSAFGSVLILIGVAMSMSATGTTSKGVARAILGLGLMLLALRLMDEATLPLRDSPLVATILSALGNAPLLAVLMAAGLAVLASSSLAVIVLAMVLAGGGIISPAMAIYLVAGANLGGAIPPWLAVAGEGVEARRLTLANLIVRGIGALVVTVLAAPIADLLIRLTGDARSLPAIAHIAFNIALLLIFLPLITPIGKLVVRILPDHPSAQGERPSYLDESLLDTPELALAVAKRETLRLGDIVAEMLDDAMKAVAAPDDSLAPRIATLEQQVDKLHEAIKLYVARMTLSELDPADSKQANEIISYAINLEQVGDIIKSGLTELLDKKARKQLSLSPEGLAEIDSFFHQTRDNLRMAQAIFLSRDLTLAQKLVEAKVNVRRIEEASAEKHLDRVRQGRVETIETSSIHMDLLRDLKRINAHVASVAYPILEEKGMLRESRVVAASG
ncbi:Na/Pi cotransporter family protein [Paracoccus aminophilus]|uniref:Na+/Pi-cotransporter n=1 Tax=Paracoccus aminophilus JCM 7686 TaxID=1367847 RepID=S5Y7G9_PARAH|nr:Na/Pi cotransporter family protein [Paracoccus aminophilus]AGT07283.1 Na+/Pi-cotransporter [Paracoccus aminophilus JCM 7686]